MLYSDNDVTHNYNAKNNTTKIGVLHISIVVLVQNNPTPDFTYLLFKQPMFLYSKL